MFKQKQRYVYLVLIIQILATTVLTLMQHKDFKIEGFQEVLYNNSILLTILFDVIFLAIMCWQNEKINLSQTWRQIPISDTKFYLSNIMSTLLACAYIFIVQVVITMLVSIPRIDRVFSDLIGMSDIRGDVLLDGSNFIVFLILMVVMICTFVSFTDFLTRIIVDFLPVKNTLWVKMLVMGILIILAAYIGAQINDHFTNFVMTRFVATNVKATKPVNSLQITNLEFLLISIVLGGLDLLFINKFAEAKIKN